MTIRRKMSQTTKHLIYLHKWRHHRWSVQQNTSTNDKNR